MALSASNAIQFEELPDRATLEQPARSLGHFSQWFKQGWDDLCIETGLPREQIEAFMNADPHGNGSVKDQITRI